MVNSRSKGKRGELEAAKLLSSVTGLTWRRSAGQQASGACRPDVEGDGWKEPLWVEVKRSSQWPSVGKAMEQAVRDSHSRGIPVVLSRKDRCDWHVTVRAKDLARFVWAMCEMLRNSSDSNTP